jgi:hypothetical protein
LIFVDGSIDSLRPLSNFAFTTCLAGIFIVAPVAGLRPILAALSFIEI